MDVYRLSHRTFYSMDQSDCAFCFSPHCFTMVVFLQWLVAFIASNLL